jgi:hypothetical protein
MLSLLPVLQGDVQGVRCVPRFMFPAWPRQALAGFPSKSLPVESL